MEKECSAGAIIFRKQEGIVYLLVYSDRNKVWGLPKGHIEVDETEKDAAIREIKEEAGIIGLRFVEGFREELIYNTVSNRGENEGKKIEKKVVYFLCEAASADVVVDGTEIMDYIWVNRYDADSLLAFDNMKALFNKAADAVENQSKKCHILDIKDLGKWMEDNSELKTVMQVFSSDHFDIDLQKCVWCGQLYVSCFIEVCMCDGEDDCWSFWVPVSIEEAETIKADKFKALDLIQSRRHITWHPCGKVYWNEGPEIAIIRGPG